MQEVKRSDMNEISSHLEKIKELYNMPFLDLVFQAHTIHRQHFNPHYIELASLLSIKTGGCPEDCAYCPQSAHFKTNLKKEALMDLEAVITEAKRAQERGAKRFCMGAAWRNPSTKDFPKVLEMIKAVKLLGLEACVTLGRLDASQSEALKEAGLDYYNHNLDTSPSYYQKIISTRSYQDRLDTLEKLRESQIKVCCGGIIGMGESQEDRKMLIAQLASLPTHPESVPINHLIPIAGTPLEKTSPLEPFEFIRTIAVTRIMMPKSVVRLSAGRTNMSEEMQAFCFMAGANSIFLGDKLLTTPNPERDQDMELLCKLGMKSHPNLALEKC
jgi:biotin synthase